MTKQVKLHDDVYDRLTKVGMKDTYSNIIKYLLDVHDNVEKMRKSVAKTIPKKILEASKKK